MNWYQPAYDPPGGGFGVGLGELVNNSLLRNRLVDTSGIRISIPDRRSNDIVAENPDGRRVYYQMRSVAAPTQYRTVGQRVCQSGATSKTLLCGNILDGDYPRYTENTFGRQVDFAIQADVLVSPGDSGAPVGVPNKTDLTWHGVGTVNARLGTTMIYGHIADVRASLSLIGWVAN